MRNSNANRYRKILQRSKRLRIHSTGRRHKDVFVHATALERAGMRGLSEGQKVSFDTQEDRRSGKLLLASLQLLKRAFALMHLAPAHGHPLAGGRLS